MLIEKCFLLQVGRNLSDPAAEQGYSIGVPVSNLAGQLGFGPEDVSTHWIRFTGILRYLSTPTSW